MPWEDCLQMCFAGQSRGFTSFRFCLVWFHSGYASPWCQEPAKSVKVSSFTLLIFSSSGACAACLNKGIELEPPGELSAGTCSRQHLLTAVSASP